MSTQHSALTGSELHILKGADAASANTVPIADGSGDSAWNKIGVNNINTSSIFNTNQHIFCTRIDDVSTAGTIYIAFPFACTANSAYTTLGAAISGANAGITFKNNAGSSAGTITVTQSGSAAGDVDNTTFSSNNTFTAGQKMAIETDGASTNTATLTVVLLVTRTGA